MDRPKFWPKQRIGLLWALPSPIKESDQWATHDWVAKLRGANETRQLASYSDSTQSKLDSCELDSSSSSTRNVN